MEITKETTLQKVFKHPGGREALAKYNVPCLSCPMAAREMSQLKLEDIANQYDIDLDGLLEELNKDN